MLFKFYPDCYVYIVECSDGTFYTGITWNLRLRLQRHNGLIWGGSKYTSKLRPMFFVYIQRFGSRKEAHVRELEIKKMNHNEKKKLIFQTTKEEILSAI